MMKYGLVIWLENLGVYWRYFVTHRKQKEELRRQLKEWREE